MLLIKTIVQNRLHGGLLHDMMVALAWRPVTRHDGGSGMEACYTT